MPVPRILQGSDTEAAGLVPRPILQPPKWLTNVLLLEICFCLAGKQWGSEPCFVAPCWQLLSFPGLAYYWNY